MLDRLVAETVPIQNLIGSLYPVIWRPSLGTMRCAPIEWPPGLHRKTQS
jgi:hypothetical protein